MPAAIAEPTQATRTARARSPAPMLVPTMVTSPDPSPKTIGI
jgi:hypothetical protein